MLLLTVLLAVHTINPVEQAAGSLDFTTPCTLSVIGSNHLSIILPVRAAHWNLHQCQGANGLGTDTLCFTTHAANGSTFIIPGENTLIPEAGTFYFTSDANAVSRDTIKIQDPPHKVIPQTVQISLRPDNTYIGYLYELINTPFIMAPRSTPCGFNQSDARMGTDCAGLAVYGRRRMGDTTLTYAGPRGILPFLEQIDSNEYFNSIGIFISENGDTAAAPDKGDILHFRSQVSIFLEDRGEAGILDTEDLVIQSWFSGSHICSVGENGFTEYPVRLYRWREVDMDQSIQ